MKYCIIYLTKTLGKVSEGRGYTNEEDLADSVRQIQAMGCPIMEVVRLPYKSDGGEE